MPWLTDVGEQRPDSLATPGTTLKGRPSFKTVWDQVRSYRETQHHSSSALPSDLSSCSSPLPLLPIPVPLSSSPLTGDDDKVSLRGK